MRILISLVLAALMINVAYSQSEQKFNAIYGKDSEFLFFVNGQMKLIKFYSDVIELKGQFDFKITADQISYGTNGALTISRRGEIDENIEFDGVQFFRRSNFLQLYTSLGYNSESLAFEFGIYPLNDWNFCEHFDITKNLTDPFDFIRQYMLNSPNYIAAKEKDDKKRSKAIEKKYQANKTKQQNEEFDDSVRTNTFPKYFGQISGFGSHDVTKQFEAFIIRKNSNDGLRIQWINEDKRVINFSALSDLGMRLKKIDKAPIYPELKAKIEALMSDKKNGSYYLSFYVNDGKEETSKGVFKDVKVIDVEELYKGSYNHPKETYRVNQIQYSIVCSDCDVRFSDRHGSGTVVEKSNVNSSWTYYFNSPDELNKYLNDPHDFLSPVMYGHSGQYVYISAKANKGESVTVKIVRDGVVWKETTSKGENAIATLSGFLP